jgi:adenosylcobinamide kinase / adenosylcobinamide-phosphate guanylyltransferase
MASTLLLGGARSGKSALAVDVGVRAAAAGHEVVFIATATALDGDMTERIARHRTERPPWPTIEEPHDLAAALRVVPSGTLAIVDCLTLWVSNLMLRGDDDEAIEALATEAAALAAAGTTVTVSNEVGLGVHPGNDLGRRYRDLLGRVNRAWAAAADRTLFLVAGRAVAFTDPWDLLGPVLPPPAPSAHSTSEVTP